MMASSNGVDTHAGSSSAADSCSHWPPMLTLTHRAACTSGMHRQGECCTPQLPSWRHKDLHCPLAAGNPSHYRACRFWQRAPTAATPCWAPVQHNQGLHCCAACGLTDDNQGVPAAERKGTYTRQSSLQHSADSIVPPPLSTAMVASACVKVLPLHIYPLKSVCIFSGDYLPRHAALLCCRHAERPPRIHMLLMKQVGMQQLQRHRINVSNDVQLWMAHSRKAAGGSTCSEQSRASRRD